MKSCLEIWKVCVILPGVGYNLKLSVDQNFEMFENVSTRAVTAAGAYDAQGRTWKI